MISEYPHGLMSTLAIKCNMCQVEQRVHSEDSLDNSMNLNTCAVFGTIMGSGSFSQLEQYISFCDILCMSSKTCQRCQGELALVIHELAWEVIEDAGKDKYNIAKEKGNIDQNGTAFKTVITDGEWSKRSYKSNYDALSGVGVIIRKETKKVLFVGIRNKYCCVCARAMSKNINTPPHTCYKNWNKPSTSA